MANVSQPNSTLAIILARGGSKRIPHKNIKPFGGRPMLGWAIASAVESRLFGHVIVSTDSDDIAEAARAEGADVPFLRPPELADDKTPARAVIIHAIRTYEDLSGQSYKYVCCLYGTAAFARAEDLRKSYQMLIHSPNTPFVFAATTFAHPVQRAIQEGPDGIRMMFPEFATTRTQDLDETLHDVGMFYWGRREAFVNERPMFDAQSRAYHLPRIRAQDIDTPEDWDMAEALFEVLAKRTTQ